MTLRAADFFETVVAGPWDGPDTQFEEVLDEARLAALVASPESSFSDVDISLALMDLVRDDLELSGTRGGERLTDEQMRLATRALERSCDRAQHGLRLPFRDHASWRSYWIRKGASGGGGWQARRDLLSDLFDQPYAALMAAQDRALDSTLASAVSPRERTGWPEVDRLVDEVRRHFRTATTAQDYKGVGLDCVTITEALSRQVYDHARHTPPGEAEPAQGKTKLRLDRYIEASLPGSDNVEIRKVARATIELAEAVKHGRTPDRVKAGVAADAVILLANILRRVGEG